MESTSRPAIGASATTGTVAQRSRIVIDQGPKPSEYTRSSSTSSAMSSPNVLIARAGIISRRSRWRQIER
jgi:hypothetical protein